MHARLLTAEEVADRLNLHVRTIRRFIREGRLKATRIGKEYRIADADLAGFAGPAAADSAAPARHVVASRSEEHTSELQSQSNLVCRLLPAKYIAIRRAD